MKYAPDCEQAFSCFLHHCPYIGMRGDDDEQFRLDSGNRLRELYEATFSEAYPGTGAEDTAVARDAADNGTGWRAGPWDKNPKQPSDRAVAAGTAWYAGPRVTARAA